MSEAKRGLEPPKQLSVCCENSAHMLAKKREVPELLAEKLGDAVNLLYNCAVLKLVISLEDDQLCYLRKNRKFRTIRVCPRCNAA